MDEILMRGNDGRYASVFQQYQQRIELFMCLCLGKGMRDIKKTLGSFLYKQKWNNT